MTTSIPSSKPNSLPSIDSIENTFRVLTDYFNQDRIVAKTNFLQLLTQILESAESVTSAELEMQLCDHIALPKEEASTLIKSYRMNYREILAETSIVANLKQSIENLVIEQLRLLNNSSLISANAANLESKISQLTSQIQTKEAEREKCAKEVEALKSKLRSGKGDKVKIKSKIAKLEEERLKLNQAIDAFKSEKKMLEPQLIKTNLDSSLGPSLVSHSKRILSFENKIQAIEAGIEDRRTQNAKTLNTLVSCCVNVDSRLKQLEEGFKELKSALLQNLET